MKLVADRISQEGALEVVPPLVSVVIVCYNQAHYLGEAIESALGQTYCPLEVLVVDDGSTDDTSEVAAAYSAVRYIRQTNRGLAAARNAGLHFCMGEYVLFLDADDKLLPNAVHAGIDCFFESPEAAFVFGGYRNIFSDGSPAPTSPRQLVESRHYWHLLQGNFIGMHGAVLYRWSALDKAGGFDESLKACEDYELYLRMTQNMPVRAHRETIAEYRQHDTNMSKDHAFMLRTVVGVLDKERRRIPDRGHHRALRSGIRVWKDYYGALLLEEWKKQRSFRQLLKISALWPRGVLKRALRALARRLRVAPGRGIRLGSLRRLTPISRQFGFDRGQPVDRYYIEAFLDNHAQLVRGSVLEVGDDSYSRRFGAGKIHRQDVLHVVPGSPGATIIADLAHAPHIPSASFDCIILTQTLQYIFDLEGAAATLYRILKPGGAVLATLPGISQICRDQEDKDSDCWRFTPSSARRLFARHFTQENTHVAASGNVLAATAFLEGLAVEDLSRDELDVHDPDYPLTITVVATKERRGT